MAIKAMSRASNYFKILFALVVFSLLSFTAYSQIPNPAYAALPSDSVSRKIVYTAVVQVPNASKDELFTRAQEWAARTFVDSKAAGRVEDKAAGTLVFHGLFNNTGPDDSYAFTVAIYTKDGRYKYSIDQISRTWGVMSGGRWLSGPVVEPMEYFGTVKLNKGQQGEMASFNQKMNGLIASIGAAMQPTVPKKDW